MNDIKLAMLGSKEAAKRLTEAGVLVPCPFCGAEPTTRTKVKSQCFEMTVVCFKCGIRKSVGVEICDTEFGKMKNGMIEAVRTWNTRAPILSESELKKLEGEV